jgi:5-methylcytosine-specific restriction endonuclease McrA
MPKPWAAAFYKSKPWRNVRDEVRRRDQYTCQRCGARGTEVHHRHELTPDNINNPSIALNPANLELLCWECHDKETKGCVDVSVGYCFDESGQVVPD